MSAITSSRLPSFRTQPRGKARRHRAAQLRPQPVRGHEDRLVPERRHAPDLRPSQLHLARELVDDRGVRRRAHADRLRFGLSGEARRLGLRLRLDLRALRLRLGGLDDAVRLRVGFRLCVRGGGETC